MNKPAKHVFGPVNCSTCSIDDLNSYINDCLRAPVHKGVKINFINAHLFNMCWNDRSLRDRINRSDVVAADGMAIVWSARLFHFDIPSRCNMTDCFRAYLSDITAPISTAFLIGGTQEEVERASASIQVDGPHVQITNAVSGFLSIEEYEEIFCAARQPRLVLVGMGTPRSEVPVDVAHRIWPSAIIWHIGGGTIMFFAGSLIEAPEWMRKYGLQWLHRLVIEPRRMWKRYVIGNPLFVLRVLKAALFHRGTSNINVA